EFPRLLDFVANLKNLRLEGLMTVGPITDSEREIRASFAELRELLLRARERTGLSLPVLSMGMSGDFEQAILEGSTLVRIGTLLFGPRNYALPQSQR
ncbi:MAG: alanine racemase, partial [Synergistaceae bacterium]|nr:alanine racemase [Synergistaceae bacterium]